MDGAPAATLTPEQQLATEQQAHQEALDWGNFGLNAGKLGGNITQGALNYAGQIENFAAQTAIGQYKLESELARYKAMREVESIKAEAARYVAQLQKKSKDSENETKTKIAKIDARTKTNIAAIESSSKTDRMAMALANKAFQRNNYPFGIAS